MSISKRLRYEVFRRDGFQCRYCGAKPPEAELRPDHVVPKTLGGTDDPSNLATSCDACNSGKTSTTPDAPLVADVADRALEWAQALRHSQAKMIADLEARARDQAEFERRWNNWTYTEHGKQVRIPMDATWRITVDQLIGAGLPMAVLANCIDISMAHNKLSPDRRFRYMCGVAWRKVKELHDTARAFAVPAQEVTGSEIGGDVATDLDGRVGFARELLSDIDPDDMGRLHAEARDFWQAETQDQLDIAAAHIAWSETQVSLSWLGSSTCDLLLSLPDPVIQDALRKARIELYDEEGAGFSRAAFAQKAVNLAARGYEEREAFAFLASLPPEERLEWLTYANAHFQHSLFPIISTAQVARSIKAGHGPRINMCIASGEHIPFCPARAAYWVRFNGFDCCEQEPAESHKGHRFCERHWQKAVSGEQRCDGEPVTVMSWEPADADDMAVPF